MARKGPVEAIIVDHPEEFVRRGRSTTSPRIAALLDGLAVYLPAYRNPGYYRTAMSRMGHTLCSRTKHDPETGAVLGTTIWVKDLRPARTFPAFDPGEGFEPMSEEELHG
jgi:hypothetical protein